VRHHVGGTHDDGFGHGHGRGPALTTDLSTRLERDKNRKRIKKYERFLKHNRRRVDPVRIPHREEVVRKREDNRSFVQKAKEKVKGFMGRLFGRKTG
jgi:hypothetical protein